VPDDVILRPREGGALDLVNAGMDNELAAEAAKFSPFLDLGATGLRRTAGYLDEEFLPQLRGRKGVEVFKEMSTNDPTVSAMLFAIDRLIRNVDWRVEPAGKSKEDAEAAKFVESCLEDMSSTWDDFISEALSCMTYGWAWHEIVYKRCLGPWQSDPSKRSQFDDGMVRWRKMPIRSQDTLLRWAFDEAGEIKGMVQLAPPLYKTVFIPIERSLLFRFRHYRGSPEGISMLRGAYRPWFFKKRIEEFESIGVERDLAGMPVASVPAEMLRAQPGSDQAKSVDAFKRLVKSVRRNDQEGMVFPMAYDQETKQPLYKFELLSSGGSRQFQTDQIIARYKQDILMTVLSDFILVGHESTGTYSTHVDKTGIFRTALNSVSASIADTMNRHAIPRLFLANGWKPAQLPKIVPSDVDAPDITVLAQFMQQMASMGITWFPDGDLENFLRGAARLPELDEEALERRRQMQMRSEATMFAQANSAYVMASNELTAGLQGAMGTDPGAMGGQPGQEQQGQKAIGSQGTPQNANAGGQPRKPVGKALQLRNGMLVRAGRY
jgi:hypothetical protein